MTGILTRLADTLAHHLPLLLDGWRGSAAQIGMQAISWWFGGGGQ